MAQIFLHNQWPTSLSLKFTKYDLIHAHLNSLPVALYFKTVIS